MRCTAVDRFTDAALDGELEPTARVDLDRHLSECVGCRERFQFAEWMKASVRKAASTDAPADLRARVQSALATERAGHVVVGSWRSTLLVAAAALLVFGLGGVLELRGPVREAGVATIFEDVLRAHVASYPAEVARREQVPAYFAERVGFPVRSVEFGDPSVRFVGARAAEVGGRHAVTFQYDLRGRRMTVVAFRRPSRSVELGEVVQRGGRNLRVVSVGGHLVPIVEHEGVVYALVGDLDREAGVSMAARAAVH